MKNMILGATAVIFLLLVAAALPPDPEGTYEDPWIIPHPDSFSIICNPYEFGVTGAEVEIRNARDYTTIVKRIFHKEAVQAGNPVRVPIMKTMKELPNGYYMLRMRVFSYDEEGVIQSKWSRWTMAKKDW